MTATEPGGGHLGQRIGPLVDGELSHAERERALSHLADCAPCRLDVDAHRRLKTTLGTLARPVPRADLADRLLALARLEAAAQQQQPDAPAVPGPRRSAVFAAAPAGATAPQGRSGSRRPAAPRGPRRRRVRALVGGTGAVALGLGAVLALGAPGAGGAVVDPGRSRLVVEHVAVTTEVPLTTPPVGAAVTATYRR